MLTVSEFKSLDVGDQVEAAPMFPALSRDPIVLATAQRSESGDRREFVVTYMGITVGRWVCICKDGVLSWSY